MARVWTREGTEGPRHDPYGWCQIHFEKTDGTLVVLRQSGLGYSRLYVNGAQVAESYGEDNTAEQQFQALTGVDAWTAQHLPARVEHARLRRMPPAERRLAEAWRAADAQMLRYAV